MMPEEAKVFLFKTKTIITFHTDHLDLSNQMKHRYGYFIWFPRKYLKPDMNITYGIKEVNLLRAHKLNLNLSSVKSSKL